MSEQMHTLFLINNEFGSLLRADAMLDVMDCLECMSEGIANKLFSKEFSLLSLKGVIGQGQFMSYDDFNVSFLVCLDIEGNIDYSSLEQSLKAFLDEKGNSLDEDGIQVIVPTAYCEAEEKEEEIRSGILFVGANLAPSPTIYLRSTSSIKKTLGTSKTLH